MGYLKLLFIDEIYLDVISESQRNFIKTQDLLRINFQLRLEGMENQIPKKKDAVCLRSKSEKCVFKMNFIS